MALTDDDKAWIVDAITNAIDKSEERLYRRFKDGALSEITSQLSAINTRLDGHDERLQEIDERFNGLYIMRLPAIEKSLDSIAKNLSSMAEDVAKIPLIEGEIRVMNETLDVLRNHAGV